MNRVSSVLACAALAVSIGCSDGEDGPIPAAEYGARLFADPGLSDSQFNAFSCATCHATKAGASEMLAGFSLFDSAFRASWYGGYETSLHGAVDFCYVSYMRGTSSLAKDDPKSESLYEYLVSISPDAEAPALPLTFVKDIVDDVPRGDAARGREVFDAACRSCHGALGSGEGQLTAQAVVLPDYFSTYPAVFPTSTPAEVVIEKIRHGQFFGVGGNMPPFSKESLGDEDLGALLVALGL